MNNFTSNDLMLYYFNEAESSTTQAIESSLLYDPQLQDELISIQEDIETFACFALTPSDQLMNSLLKKINNSNSVSV
jgi:hypothetical protein